MRNHSSTWRVTCGVIALGCLQMGCTFSSELTLANRTLGNLTPFPVNVDLDPPSREPDFANTIEMGGFFPIAPHGLNPVFYAAGIDDESLANGVFIGLNLLEADPLQIQYKIFHYRVPPGNAGSDPDLQPILIAQDVVDVEDVNMIIGILARDTEPGGWQVRITPG